MVTLDYVGTPQIATISVDEAKIEDVSEVTAFVEGELEKMDCPMKSVIQINVAIDEIFSNIVRYGYEEKSGPVKIEIIENSEPHGVSIRFIDSGIQYNPLETAEPDITLSAEERGIGGLGIFMVKKSMDNVEYVFRDNQNIFTITKNI